MIIESMSKLVKYDMSLIHVDLSYCRLNERCITDIGTQLRRAKTLIAIHFTGNTGVTQETKDFLYTRIHAKRNADYDIQIEQNVVS